jgi:hypothetical protein
MDRLVTRLALAASGLLIIATAAIAAGVWLCVALYFALLTWLTPPLAALATAAGVLLAAGLIVLVVVLALRSRRTTNEPMRTRLDRELTDIVSRHAAVAVPVALLAGFAVGAVPPLREALKDVLAK